MMVVRAEGAPIDVTTEDPWFAAIDGQEIDLPDSEPRRLHVEGIHESGNELWMQIAPLADWDHGILLHCWRSQSPYAVLALVRTMLKRSARPKFIDADRRRHDGPVPNPDRRQSRPPVKE
jgi:hypothetical protein